MAIYAGDFVILRDGVEVYRSHWYPEGPLASEPGYTCGHAAVTARQLADPAERCGWCDLQGLNSEFLPTMVVKCPNCETVCIDDPTGGVGSFIAHLTEECWQ